MKDNKTSEIRSIAGNVELRAADETDPDKRPIIEGYAAKFDKETIIGEGWGFMEIVDRNAFDNCDMTDVVAKFNHDPNMAMSRTGAVNNLELTVDNVGLKYSFRAANECGEMCAENIRLNIVRGSSFEFQVKSTEWVENYKVIDGTTYELRRIKEIKKLFDVAPVLNPAYADTTVALRSRPDKPKPKTGNEIYNELRFKK